MTALDSASQSYDTDGNVTTLHTGVTVDWDDAGRVQATHVSSSATAGIEGDNEYGYLDGKKVWRKITRSSSLVTNEVYVYSGPNRIAEYDSGVASTTPNVLRIFGDEIDSLTAIVQSNGDVLIPTRNRQWSIVSLTDNSDGNVLERYAYDQFGKRTIYAANGVTVRSASNYNNFGYTSREHQPEAGVMYFRTRHYDQLAGEFLSRDLLGFTDGFSTYRGYFLVNLVDPTGLKGGCRLSVNCELVYWEYSGTSTKDCYYKCTEVYPKNRQPIAGVLGEAPSESAIDCDSFAYPFITIKSYSHWGFTIRGIGYCGDCQEGRKEVLDVTGSTIFPKCKRSDCRRACDKGGSVLKEFCSLNAAAKDLCKLIGDITDRIVCYTVCDGLCKGKETLPRPQSAPTAVGTVFGDKKLTQPKVRREE